MASVPKKTKEQLRLEKIFSGAPSKDYKLAVCTSNLACLYFTLDKRDVAHRFIAKYTRARHTPRLEERK